MYYVYVLRSLNNKDLYIGLTKDLRKRFEEHNRQKVFSTKPNTPWVLIYYEAYKSRKDAVRREKQLKKHKAKIDLKEQLKYSLEISGAVVK